MFIAVASTNQAKLRRSERDVDTRCAPTELGNLNSSVSINISSLRD
jgi:hypothetical protein